MSDELMIDPVSVITQLIKLTRASKLSWSEQPGMQSKSAAQFQMPQITGLGSRYTPVIESAYLAKFNQATLKLLEIMKPSLASNEEAKRRVLELQIIPPSGNPIIWSEIQALRDLLAAVRFNSAEPAIKDFFTEIFKE